MLACAVICLSACWWTWKKTGTRFLDTEKAIELLRTSTDVRDHRAALVVITREANLTILRLVELSHRDDEVGELARAALTRLRQEIDR